MQKEIHSSYRKAYWFSRMLINGDKYGSVGKDTQLMLQLASSIQEVLNDSNYHDDVKVRLSNELIKNLLAKKWKKGKKHQRVKLLCDDLHSKLGSVADCFVFALTCERIIIPIELSLKRIPSNDLEFTRTKATHHLNSFGEYGLATLINYFGIPAAHAPEHFTAGIEVDKWVKGSDGWYVGISCKRTLRERWKQAYTSDLDLLNRYKIKNLFHLITYDADLSDDKVTEMGSYRVVIYLPDKSRRYLEISRLQV